MKRLIMPIVMLSMLLVAWIATVQAAPMDTLYQAQILVPSESQEDWRQALPHLLTEVLVKISGSQQILQTPLIKQQLADPEALVQSFTYGTTTDANGLPTILLHVQFNIQAINQLLQQAGASQTSGRQQKQAVVIRVTNVNGLDDLTAVLQYLRSLPSVTSAEVSSLNGSDLLINVGVTGGLAALNAAIGSATSLQLVAATTTPGIADNSATTMTSTTVTTPSLPTYQWTTAPPADIAAPVTSVTTTPVVATPPPSPPAVTNPESATPAPDKGIDMSEQ